MFSTILLQWHIFFPNNRACFEHFSILLNDLHKQHNLSGRKNTITIQTSRAAKGRATTTRLRADALVLSPPESGFIATLNIDEHYRSSINNPVDHDARSTEKKVEKTFQALHERRDDIELGVITPSENGLYLRHTHKFFGVVYCLQGKSLAMMQFTQCCNCSRA